MEHYMAEFGQGFVQAAVLSENNAVKYRLSIAGSCTRSSVRPYIKLQDTNIGPATYSSGMNVVVFDPQTLKVTEIKTYDFTSVPSTINRAFMTYVDSLPSDKVVIMVSEGKLRTCIELVDWFKKHNSTAWPTVWDLTHYDAAYSAFYITNITSISSEHVLWNDGVKIEAINPHLDVVFDYYQDIGATGVPNRIGVLDGTVESQGGDPLELIRLPTEELQAPISDYNLVAGDMFYIKFQLKTGIGSGPGPSPNGATRCSIRWFLGEDLISFTNIMTGDAFIDQWQTFERYIPVPSGIDGFTIYFAKTDVEDYGAVQNVVITEVPREEMPLFRSAEFGVNGIRMNSMIDGTVDELLILNDTKTDDRGRVRGAEFREKY